MKTETSKLILLYECMGFGTLAIFLWLDEVLDIPHLVFGSPPTPINWSEGMLETFFVLILAGVETTFTKHLLVQIKHFEGLIPVCGFCQRVRDGRNWVSLETFVKNHSEAELTHGLNSCPECQAKQFPIEPTLSSKKGRTRKENTTIMKTRQIQRILRSEAIGFGVLFLLLWLDEILDLPHLIFGAKPTPINWGESMIESLYLMILCFFLTGLTRRLLTRVKHLQGRLITCCFCENMFDGEEWVPASAFIENNSQAEFSSAVCIECLLKKFCGFSLKKTLEK